MHVQVHYSLPGSLPCIKPHVVPVRFWPECRIQILLRNVNQLEEGGLLLCVRIKKRRSRGGLLTNNSLSRDLSRLGGVLAAYLR